jgi:hypothetical protein
MPRLLGPDPDGAELAMARTWVPVPSPAEPC